MCWSESMTCRRGNSDTSFVGDIRAEVSGVNHGGVVRCGHVAVTACGYDPTAWYWVHFIRRISGLVFNGP